MALRKEHVIELQIIRSEKVMKSPAGIYMEQASPFVEVINLRMIPEGNYWKIDGYRGQTGLMVIQNPKS